MTDYPPEPHVINEDRWAAIPEALLCDPSIPADAVRVYGVLRRHGNDPTNCYPSHARIAALIGKSPRSIYGWIKALDDAGWVDRIPRDSVHGDPDTNAYRTWGRAQERGVHAGERGGVHARERGGSTRGSATKESKRNESNLNESSSPPTPALRSVIGLVPAERLFNETFWTNYPRKTGRPAALRSWKAARGRASVETICAGLASWCAYWQNAHTEPTFIPHPATWLNQDRWNDTPPPLPTARRSRHDEQMDDLASLAAAAFANPLPQIGDGR